MRILLADDEVSILKTLGDALRDAGHELVGVSSGDEALRQLKEEEFDCVVSDIRMPGASGMEVLRTAQGTPSKPDVVLITGYATVEDAVAAIKAGAHDYVAKPFLNEDVVLKVERAGELRRLRAENFRLKREIEGKYAFANIVGESPAMKKVFEQVEAVCESEFCVLIVGESGTGKELVARAVHHHSPRKGGAFVAVSSSAAPESLLQDELFGHEKGAFTDARSRHAGCFEQADGGTLFLDDIDDMPLAMQAKLLRVLQEKEFTRLGGEKSIRVDVRVVAAAKTDLRALVERNGFREDLYYRLAELFVFLPPLRERIEDVPLLVEHFLGLHEGEKHFRLAPGAQSALAAHAWPGNVRELENCVKRAIALSPGEEIPAGLFLPAARASAGGEGPLGSLKEAVSQAEKEHIGRVLRACSGNRTRAAEALGISRKNLWEKMKRHVLE